MIEGFKELSEDQPYAPLSSPPAEMRSFHINCVESDVDAWHDALGCQPRSTHKENSVEAQGSAS